MTYDFAASGTSTGHNSPLYGADSTNTSVAAWIAGGVDKAKLSISVPFYGRSFSLLSEDNNKLGAPAKAGIGGPFTKSPGTIGYNEVILEVIFTILLKNIFGFRYALIMTITKWFGTTKLKFLTNIVKVIGLVLIIQNLLD